MLDELSEEKVLQKCFEPTIRISHKRSVHFALCSRRKRIILTPPADREYPLDVIMIGFPPLIIHIQDLTDRMA